MPELPEVEIAVRALRRAIVGRTLTAVERLHASSRTALAARDAARVIGRRVVAVERVGKHQLLVLDDGAGLHAHFRMAGDWHADRVTDAPHHHARVTLDLDDGSRVSLVDPRALATIVYRADASTALPTLGPEPTDPSFDSATLRAALRTRRGPIKPVLLDQRVVAGIGNIYAAEALWEARISPRAAANRLGAARVARLVDAMRTVLNAALEHPGRYANGETVDAMHVYGRDGQPCHCCGATVARITQAGRSTYYCPRCQAR